jgi:hypothetical protein
MTKTLERKPCPRCGKVVVKQVKYARHRCQHGVCCDVNISPDVRPLPSSCRECALWRTDVLALTAQAVARAWRPSRFVLLGRLK